MFEKMKYRKELKKLCNTIYHNGRHAIYQTEIVKCYQMQSLTAYVRFADGRFLGVGFDTNEQFHYID